MSATLHFFGAARNVTGSCYLLEVNGARVLVDCGMYQERDFQHRNWEPFPFNPKSLDAALLTHAHLDHCGLLPKLVKDGFNGPIYCTRATGEIAGVVMTDSGKIQEEDMAYKKKRHEREDRESPHPYEPLYTQDDAEAVMTLMKSVPFGQPEKVADGVTATFSESGHILGAASIIVDVTTNGAARKLLFSGDIGRWNMPIINDPTTFAEADYLVVESTYGDRLHEKEETIPDQLERIINEARERGGNVVVPSFSVERAQDILYHLYGLLRDKRIKKAPTFLDSPMAIRVTDIFTKHPELFDDELMAMVREGAKLSNYPGLKFTRSAEESKAINQIKSGAIIIAGSGMCTGGRVKHHLINNITDDRNTVMFVGYQAVGTLGRTIVGGAKTVRIHGGHYPVEAHIEQVGGFSGHADQSELLRWTSALGSSPKKVFVTHGEEEAATTFAGLLNEQGLDAHPPEYKDAVELP